MTQIITIGLDLAKQVFQVHGADAEGAPLFKRQLRRADVLRALSLRRTPPLLSGSRPAEGPITGRVRSLHSAMMSG